MSRNGKKYVDATRKFDRERLYTPDEALGINKGSGEPNREKVGTLTAAQCRQIAERKMPDLNANDLDAASRIVAGTARSMGVEIGRASCRERV